ncbi:MmgE/PrpD family protein [Verticiella sediminum]|uniref:MmgE/PrpD family protein n=1 Tax=Verticiella sediminum TaxID=1247510 RepID=A0A556ACV8_9BURK|nr:MmgE/PrpD family protein [Verticiella sediminum]TSH90717.1 MmgE/PrpD family protein [Verticiella sediminum]
MRTATLALDTPDAGTLAQWLAGPGPAALPEAAARSVRASLLDTVAVAWAARGATGMPAVSALVAADGGAAHSLLWDGSGRRVPAAAAAFHNGGYAAALDFDSLHPDVSHIDAVVIPAAIAVAEQVHADGRALLAAIAAGNELAYRLARAGQARPGWFRTSVYGVFGAAAAAGRLLGLDAAGIESALGLALGQAAGTQQGHVERTLSKRLLSAFAARAGVFSAQLAQAGISGPRRAFDGRHGLYALYGQADPGAPESGLGREFLLEHATYKRYPACGRAHAAIEAALRLARPADGPPLAASAIEAVELVLTEDMHTLVGAPYTTDGDPEVTAQFCAQYAVAAALASGRFGLAQITPQAVLDPALRPLIDRVNIRVQGSGSMAPATVAVRLNDGRRLTQTVAELPGGLLDPQALREKAASALTYGAGLDTATADRLLARLETVEDVADVADLFGRSSG